MKQYLGMAFLLVVVACNNPENKSTDKKDSSAINNTEVSTAAVTFKDQEIDAIYGDYIRLKDALVATKFEEAKSAAKALVVSLNGHAGCENTAIIAGKIENAKDIAEQRKEFTALSADVIALFKHTSISNGAIYVQHCPMANKGDGGDWLASEKKIQNPYYGSEMMECGAVVEEIKAK
ncbi:DUF3347 domain-containing protein [Pedobacter insulae]|uniref:DUF3347 domain-containing protein n=1 Tax=Pedobacter insulae TaxID=414048 RepID=A0A1I3AHI9_9SPHI|nr:DUF3347 domain-containing protein [Pedobacter insulae]SFH49524.1 Protein of unknown function [Pedobacter insulae]